MTKYYKTNIDQNAPNELKELQNKNPNRQNVKTFTPTNNIRSVSKIKL